MSKKASPLAKFKAIWRDQLYKDRELTASAFRIGYGIADYMTMDGTVALYLKKGRIVIWPSQGDIQRSAGTHIDTIRDCVQQLIRNGHLERRKRGNQFTGSNTYRIIITECR